MHDRIKNGANLLEKQVFQFDFLNDDFSKLPASLQDIINDSEKRKKLIIYINPPYAEHGNRTTIIAKGEHKSEVATKSRVHQEFSLIVGTATRELFAQFFLRVYKEIPDAKLASFSTLKLVNSQNFIKFRQYFKAKYKNGFICRANTFDNVKGKFPICFSIWDLSEKVNISTITTNTILNNNLQTRTWIEGTKSFHAVGKDGFISAWLRKYYDKKNNPLAYLILPGVDMQQQNGVYITEKPTESDLKQHKTASITKVNIMVIAIYFTVRQCIEHTWINNQDQFLYPNGLWEKDSEFKNDCLAFLLFHNQNKICTINGTNHWIPFTEREVEAQERFKSNFMTEFIQGKLQIEGNGNLLESEKNRTTPLEFSTEAQAVFAAGLALWRYYHAQPKANPNASLYEIKAFFQGRNDKGRMNSKSEDAHYTKLLSNLKEKLHLLSKKIEPKVYQYVFLKD